jgi:hypothetical protein
LSVNVGLVDKPSQRDMKSSSSDGWIANEIDLDMWIQHVTAGHAFAPQFKDGYRKGGNFICAGFLAADFDEGVTLDEARNNAFINAHAAFIYTTASHTNESHRFRVVFVTETVIENGQDWADANFALAFQLGSDLSVNDKARCFFGSSNARVWHSDHILAQETLDQLIASGRELRSARNNGYAVDSSIRLQGDADIKLADGSLCPLSSIPAHTSVHCPHHEDRRASAFVVPSWTRGGLGIHCRSCARTYWAADADGYDFNAFDKLVEFRIANPQSVFEPKNLIEEFFPPAPDCVMTQDRFLAPITYEPGVTLVKSAKGTGKTAAVASLVADVKNGRFPPSMAKKDKPKSIILIGHRRTLLSEAARRIGLPYYLDLKGTGQTAALNELAVCLDSLPKFVEGGGPSGRKSPTYDLVIIDESEQVLSHLIGDTIAKRHGGVERCYDALSFVIRNAKAVVALDADLGMLTTHALRYLRPTDWH